MDFYKDFIDLSGVRNFFENSFDKNDRELIFFHYNLLKKRIPRKKWKIARASDFDLNLAESIKEAILEIEKLAKNGDDLSFHCSCELNNPSKYDSLIFDWKIFHLHPGHGNKKAKYSQFVNRANELLFLTHDIDTLYFISVMDHDSFCKIKLLEIVQREWGFLLEPFETRMLSLSYDVNNDSEVKKLRKCNINYAVNINGTNYTPIGGGYDIGGASSDASDLSIYTIHALGDITREMESYCLNNNLDKDLCRLVDISTSCWIVECGSEKISFQTNIDPFKI